MAISGRDEIRDRVREAADIVQVIGEHVQLRRAGNRFTGLCPFHAEKTPSFSVSPQGQFFKCFGCGEAGDVFTFLMKQQNLSFPEALQELAKRCQISLPEPREDEAEQQRRRQRGLLRQINAEAAALYHDCLLTAPQAEPARQYLRQRGVPQAFIVSYQLGCAPAQWDFLASRLTKQFPAEAVEQAGLIVRRDQGGWYDRFRSRVLFPIRDLSGATVAFGGRILGEGQPKYMNSPESLIFEKGRILFGLHQHREAIRASRRAVLVEGNFDLLLLDVHGIGNTAAPLGTALTREHLKALRPHCGEAVLLFDGDSAGLRAARRAVPLFLTEQMEAKVALLPAGHDPDTLVREQGAEAVLQLLAAAQPLPEFVFEALVREHGLTLSGKNRILAELAELLRQCPGRAQQELMAAHFAAKLGVGAGALLAGTAPARPQPVSAPVQTGPEQAAAPLPGKQRQLLEFLVFYPEFFNELRAGGLEEHSRSCAPPVQAVVAALLRLAAAGPFLPEQLLAALPEGEARQHVAGLLLRGAAAWPDEGWAQDCCAELLAWLRAAQRQQAGAGLLLRLRQAQEAGDSSSVRLLTEQLLAARKEAAGA